MNALSAIHNPTIVSKQELFDCNLCGEAFCGKVCEWIEFLALASATVLAIIGVALSFFYALPEFAVICSITAVVTTYQAIMQCITSDEEALDENTSKLRDFSTSLGQTSASLIASNARMTKDLETAQSAASELRKTNERLSTSIASLQAQLAIKSSTEQSLPAQSAKLADSTTELTTQLEAFATDIQTLNELVSGYDERTRMLGGHLGLLSSGKDDVKEMGGQVAKEAGLLHEFRDQTLKTIAVRITQTETLWKQINEFYAKANARLTDLTGKLEQADRELDSDRDDMRATLSTLQATRTQTFTDTTALQQISEQLEESRKALAAITAEREVQQKALEELRKQFASTQRECQETLAAEKAKLLEANLQTAASLEALKASKQKQLDAITAKIAEKMPILTKLMADLTSSSP